MKLVRIFGCVATLYLGLSMTALADQHPPLGASTLIAHVPFPGYPEGIVVHEGVIYVSGPAAFGVPGNASPSAVFAFDLHSGALLKTITIQNQTGPLKSLSCIAVDEDDNLYVLDETQGVVKIDLKTGRQSVYSGLLYPGLPFRLQPARTRSAQRPRVRQRRQPLHYGFFPGHHLEGEGGRRRAGSVVPIGADRRAVRPQRAARQPRRKQGVLRRNVHAYKHGGGVHAAGGGSSAGERPEGLPYLPGGRGTGRLRIRKVRESFTWCLAGYSQISVLDDETAMRRRDTRVLATDPAQSGVAAALGESRQYRVRWARLSAVDESCQPDGPDGPKRLVRSVQRLGERPGGRLFKGDDQ